jgi:hypothetical protein
MSETSEERVSAALKAAALKAGMIDLDGLKLADVSKVTLEDDGTVKGAAELVVALKERWPYLFGKHARDMTPEEQVTWWKDHKKKFRDGSPPPKPLDMSKKATDMTRAEQDAFLKDCARRE